MDDLTEHDPHSRHGAWIADLGRRAGPSGELTYRQEPISSPTTVLRAILELMRGRHNGPSHPRRNIRLTDQEGDLPLFPGRRPELRSGKAEP